MIDRKSHIANDLEQPASTRSLAGRLWREYIARYKGRLAIALMAMAAYAASASAIPLGLEWINNALSDAGGAQGPSGADPQTSSARRVLLLGPVLILALGVVNGLAQYIQARLSVGAALSAMRDMQQDMFSQLMALDLAQIRREASGQTISRFTNDPLILRETLTRLARAVGDLKTLLGLCGVMIFYDWVLFVVVVVVYGALAWPIATLGKRLRKGSAQTQAQAGDLAAFVSDAASGAEAIKTYRGEDIMRARAGGVFDERLRLMKRVAYLRALNEPMIFIIGACAMAIVIGIVALRIMDGALDAAQFISFIVALLMLSQPARGLSTLNAVAQEGFAAFERILAVIDARPEIVDPPNAPALDAVQASVAFEDVYFRYGAGEKYALNGMTFTAEAGQTVALVGPSGAGKSTILALLSRLYVPERGAIKINNIDIAGVSLTSLRSHCAYVSQDAFLFDDTIRANIALGDPDADDQKIIVAAKAANAHDFIMASSQGYDTPVGEGGGALSGGQKQRIALARAFLKDSPILLLDEATAALDAQSEARVQEALARISKGRTTIVIAHRLATVRSADKIVVVENGASVEEGPHGALLAADGAYARLYALQFAEKSDQLLTP
ncbi:MAG: ABC transporter ATP-binding protein [Pseudomonadota bacterium]